MSGKQTEGAAVKRAHISLKVLFLILLSPTWLSADSDGSAANAFKQLSSLVGTWEGKFEDGRPHSVSYRLTAGGTVLVETWTLGPGRESMTLYHIDGDALVADHYCPQGNTPRLELTKGGGADKLSFVFRDGTNLQVKGKSHQRAFWIKVNGKNSFERGETYVENGGPSADAANMSPGKAVTYTRMASPGHER
jgi:hypothetical protein